VCADMLVAPRDADERLPGDLLDQGTSRTSGTRRGSRAPPRLVLGDRVRMFSVGRAVGAAIFDTGHDRGDGCGLCNTAPQETGHEQSA
jgi:hypothetical protein